MSTVAMDTKASTAADCNKENMNTTLIPEMIEERRKDYDGRIIISKYSRGKLLGKGGFAKCYVGTLLATKVNYALKIISKSTLAKTRAKQKLQTEIKIHKSLSHIHVARFERFFEDNTFAYIVLELCSNNSMSELMKRRKKLSEYEVRYYVIQLIRALEYLHSNGIIHRDLKLGNLFINGDMQLKVGDFGLATRVTHADERKRTVCGTPNYIAPEILEGKDGHSFEVDIWSTGVVIFTLLVGKPPFESKDVKSTYKRILANAYSFPELSDPSEHSRSLIRNMLQPLPDRRPSISDMFRHSFFLPMSGIPSTLSTSCLREPPLVTDFRYPSHRSNDENLDPSALNAFVDKLPLVPTPDKRPAIPFSADVGMDKRPTSGDIRLRSSTVAATTNSGSKKPIRGVLTSRLADSNPVSKLIPATRPVALRPATSGGQTNDIYVDHKTTTSSSKSSSTRPSTGDKPRSTVSSTTSSNALSRYSPKEDTKKVLPVVPLRENYVTPNTACDVNEIQMDMDNVKLEDKQPPVAVTNKRKPIEQDALALADDDEFIVSAGPAFKNIQTPKNATTSTKDLGTIETMYGTLSQSFTTHETYGFGAPSLQQSSTRLRTSLSPTASIWVVRYVDYTSKYGLGFLLNTGSAGVYFNDSTKVVMSPDHISFQYIERKRRNGLVGEHSIETHLISNYPPELHKKVTLLKHFGNYLIEQEKEEKSTHLEMKGFLKMNEIVKEFTPIPLQASNKIDDVSTLLPYLKKWVRTRHAILFRLSNKTVQVVFFDKSEVLLSSEAHVVTYVDKLGLRSEHSLQDVLLTGRSDIAKRLKYTKDIMYRLISMQTK